MNKINEITARMHQEITTYLNQSILKAINHYKKFSTVEVKISELCFETEMLTFSIIVEEKGVNKESAELKQTFDFIDSLHSGNLYAFEDILSLIDSLKVLDKSLYNN